MRYIYEHMEDFEGVVFPDFKQYSGNLILHGAGINGALCAFTLENLGVEFLCFSDNDPSKQNTEYIGHPVYSPAECSRRFPNAVILFEAYTLDKDSIEELNALGYQTILFPIPLLLDMDCDAAAAFITKHLNREDESYSFRDEVDSFQVYEWIDEYMIRGVGYVTKKRTMSRSVNLDLTDQCTLRCKNCLALKPYFTKRTELPWEQTEQIIDHLLSLKWFRRFHVMGGEPFLCTYLDKALEKLCASPEVEHINILTNGTVIPNEAVLKQLEDPKIVIRVSYYGELSKNYRELENICFQRGIKIRVHAQRWKDIGRALEKISDEQETKVRYNRCCQPAGAFFYTLHGKVSICPFAANTYALGLYESDGEDVVDLLNTVSPEVLFERLNALYWRKVPLTACYYCNGWLSYDTKPVPVAVQYAAGEQPVLPSYSKQAE